MRTSPTRLILVVAGLTMPLAVSGCELEDFLDRFDDFDTCAGSANTAEVGGEWELTGSGTRSSCNDERFNGDFNLSSTTLLVIQEPSATSDDTLTLAQPMTIPGGDFTLTGTVRGACVDFTTVEDGTTGFFEFVFDGNYEGGELAGDFTGQGPPGCRSSGEFRVRID